MATQCPPGETRAEAALRFESTADAIMYRWSTERDTWVSTSEVEQARAYLERAGVETSPLPDGRYLVSGRTAATLEAARLVLLGLRTLHEARRVRQA